jgi:hypothetical protein
VTLAAGDLRADPAAVCADVVARVCRAGADVVLLEVRDDGPCRADLATLDGLARLQLAVRRAGARVVLAGSTADLRALLVFTGLAEALAGVASGGEPQRQSEHPEVVGPHEVRDAADPAVAHLEDVHGPRLEPPGSARLVLGESS